MLFPSDWQLRDGNVGRVARGAAASGGLGGAQHSYTSLFRLLQSAHSIWQLSGTVCPPLLQGTM